MPVEAPAAYWCNRVIEYEAQAERAERQLRRLQAERDSLIAAAGANGDPRALARIHALKAEIFAVQAMLIDCRAAVSVARGHMALALERPARKDTAA